MPASGGRSSTNRIIAFLLYAFAAIAAFLYLLNLFSANHLFPPGPDFEDVKVYVGRFTVYHTARFFTARAFSTFAYPAGCAPLYELLYKFHDPVQAYLIIAITLTVLAVVAAAIFLHRRGHTTLIAPLLLAISFPVIFLIQRSNIELVLWLLTALALLAFRRGWVYPAAILIGLAAACKLYPILLLGLFLKRRRDFPAFALGLITFAIAMIAAIAYTGPTFPLAAHGFFHGVDNFQDHYVDTVSRVEVAFDHCFFSPLKYYAFSHHSSPASWRTLYYLGAGIIAGLLYLRARTMPFLNRAVFLSGAMVALPPVSFLYTLTHLYVPTLLLFVAIARIPRPPVTALICFALLLTLLSPFPGLSAMQPLPTGPIQSAILFALLLFSILQPWPPTREVDTL